jgi:hypothetical protein
MSTNSPKALPIGTVLDDSEPLARLAQRIRESRLRLEAVAPLMPAALRQSVRPGPVDDTQWCLLVSNASVAAKIRQWVPAFENALIERGWKPTAIKIRIQPDA